MHAILLSAAVACHQHDFRTLYRYCRVSQAWRARFGPVLQALPAAVDMRLSELEHADESTGSRSLAFLRLAESACGAVEKKLCQSWCELMCSQQPHVSIAGYARLTFLILRFSLRDDTSPLRPLRLSEVPSMVELRAYCNKHWRRGKGCVANLYRFSIVEGLRMVDPSLITVEQRSAIINAATEPWARAEIPRDQAGSEIGRFMGSWVGALIGVISEEAALHRLSQLSELRGIKQEIQAARQYVTNHPYIDLCTGTRSRFRTTGKTNFWPLAAGTKEPTTMQHFRPMRSSLGLSSLRRLTNELQLSMERLEVLGSAASRSSPADVVQDRATDRRQGRAPSRPQSANSVVRKVNAKPRPATARPRTKEDASDGLVAFYQHHAPAMVTRVPALLSAFEGREAHLCKKLHAKYGAEPSLELP